MTRSGNRGSTEAHDPHWIEWLVGIAATLIVATLIGWIGYEAFTEKPQEPDLAVQIGQATKSPDGYRITFDIENRANTTASGVVVRGEISENGEPLEDAEVTFDYVPAQSTESGAMIFRQDPQGRTLSIRAVGYTDP